MDELRGFEDQMVALENDIIMYQNEIQKLQKAREDDAQIRDEMLAEIEQLEEDKEQFQREIDDLEKELLSNNCLQVHAKDSIVSRISNIKQSQMTRQSMRAGSEVFKKQRILQNQGKFAAHDLQGMMISNDFSPESGVLSNPSDRRSSRVGGGNSFIVFREDQSTVNRDSSASIEFFSQLEQRRASSPVKNSSSTKKKQSTINNLYNSGNGYSNLHLPRATNAILNNLRQTTGLNPIQEGVLEDDDYEGRNDGSMASSTQQQSNFIKLMNTEQMQDNQDDLGRKCQVTMPTPEHDGEEERRTMRTDGDAAGL